MAKMRLLIRGDTVHISTNLFLVLNFCLDVVDCIRGLDFEVVLPINVLTKNCMPPWR